uniref:DNA-directed RNA polymerase n=1 Tax=Nitzschia sp. PL3-2 TaxID=2083271 RepID=A0A2Z5ZAQ8_9STRA|nr:RNA polymerase beta'' subunit [Nitzschia sp. PL3-2]
MKNYIYNNNLVKKKDLRNLIKWILINYNNTNTSLLIDTLKNLGFFYATQGAISISIEDLKVPSNKKLLLKKIESEIFETENFYYQGKITEAEKLQYILNLWESTNELLRNQVIQFFKKYDPLNSVYIMAFSGARGNISQVRQLVGMRGLMADQHGQVIDLPIVQNFQEGLTITDYLISSYGARKGLIDTALKTADSGYLTRRLIDVSQDIIIREKNCFTSSGLTFSYLDKEELLGRFICKNMYNPTTKKILFKKDTHITLDVFDILKKKKINNIRVRSPLTCDLYRSVCQKCYGWDLSNYNLIDMGSAIGILAGQSIGEPGTQLTMRTFHTGGVVDLVTTDYDSSPLTGIFQFCNNFKGLPFRTNSGVIGRIIKKKSSAIIIPVDQKKKILKLNLLPNNIILLKNNQFIKEGSPIGDLSQTIKLENTIREPIRSIFSGEVEILNYKQRIKSLIKNNEIWVLSSKILFSPVKSFINFYKTYRINKNNSIFRSKINFYQNGLISYKKKTDFLKQEFLLKNNIKFILKGIKLKKLKIAINKNNFFLKEKKFSCLLEFSKKNILFPSSNKNIFGLLILKNFIPEVGGTGYYNYRNKNKKPTFNYIKRKKSSKKSSKKYFSGALTKLRTFIWFNEESYNINFEKTKILARSGNKIFKKSLLAQGIKSKTSGLLQIKRNGIFADITIKTGVILDKFKNRELRKILHNKLFFPGEIKKKKISLFKDISTKKTNRMLKKYIEIYETPFSGIEIVSKKIKFFDFKLRFDYPHSSGYSIKEIERLNIISSNLTLTNNSNIFIRKKIKFLNESKKLKINLIPTLYFKDYIIPKLYNKAINLCLLVQKRQYLNLYSILAYLESITSISLEIIKINEKRSNNLKYFSLISNNDCFQVKKSEVNINEIYNKKYIKKNNLVGKILFDTKDNYIVRKGIPYLFPESEVYKTNPNKLFNIKKKFLIAKKKIITQQYKNYNLYNYNFCSFFISKINNNFYNPNFFIPQFLHNFKDLEFYYNKNNLKVLHDYFSEVPVKIHIGKKQNRIKSSFLKSFKIIPLISEDVDLPKYYRLEGSENKIKNLIFFNHEDYIMSGNILGFLNLKKRTASDIVQGLPQISAALEGRIDPKKLACFTFINTNYIFHKIGIPIIEENNINPHLFLKIYFTYYGSEKIIQYSKNKIFKKRLLDNYNAAYRSLKKVELLILNFINNTYQSQGVNINTKHFEIIIKQMTDKTIITKSNDSPFYSNDVVDLYHLKYINSVLKQYNKKLPYYIPVVFGISRSALNNPSFLSAASFQETVSILSYAALEGRIDWLRGLKENVITGNLLPIGSGNFNYKLAFQKDLNN